MNELNGHKIYIANEVLGIPTFNGPALLTGYQYGPTSKYIGSIEFHNNRDKEEVHLPQNTTLSVPMPETELQEPHWNSLLKIWELKDKEIVPKNDIPQGPIEHVDDNGQIHQKGVPTQFLRAPVVGDFIKVDHVS